MKPSDSKKNDSDLIRICKMYYIENCTQEQIARTFGVSRSQVSRLLNEARKRGLVEIKIHEDKIDSTNLGNKIVELFGLRETVIAGTGDRDHLENIARAGASYLGKIIEDGMIVGISWGRTLAKVIEYMITSKKLNNTVFVPLLGGVGQHRYEYQVNALVEKIADVFHSNRYYLHAPAFFEDNESLRYMLSNESVRTIVDLWDRLDLAVVGIGEPISLSNAFRSVLPQNFVTKLVSQAAVGDIAARFFDQNGNVCELKGYQDHVLGISLEQLRNTPRVIGIAGGEEKVKAICAAMKGKFINVLITDIRTAREIVRVIEQ